MPEDWFSPVHSHVGAPQTVPLVQEQLPLLPQSDNLGDHLDHPAVAVQQQSHVSPQQRHQEAVEPYSRPQQNEQMPGISQWSPEDPSSVYPDVWPGSCGMTGMLGSPASQ